MIKKLATLASALLLLAACSSSPDEEIISGSGSGSGAAASAAGGGSGATDLTASDIASGPSPGTQEDFVVNVGDRIYFDLNSSTLNDGARTTLDRQAAWLLQYGNITVTIEGHSDERGTREYNLALGDRRAAAARTYLVALGVDSGRLLTLSYGEERPVDPGHDETAWAQNRRAVTVVNLVN